MSTCVLCDTPLDDGQICVNCLYDLAPDALADGLTDDTADLLPVPDWMRQLGSPIELRVSENPVRIRRIENFAAFGRGVYAQPALARKE